jgi:hypothetical protein
MGALDQTLLALRRDLLDPHFVADLFSQGLCLGLVLRGQDGTPMRLFEHAHDVGRHRLVDPALDDDCAARGGSTPSPPSSRRSAIPE